MNEPVSITPNILYLDDEALNLDSFKATFRRKYHVFTAQNPDEAFEILSDKDIHIVISDQRMPQMSGVEFLSKVKLLYPETIRMIITGYIDIQSVIDSINQGEVYRFLSKPWRETELDIAIRNSADIFFTKKALLNKSIELNKAYEELDQFVYSASHELRAPITTIKSILQLIDLHPESKEEMLEYISMLTDKLDQYVLNIIEYYKCNRIDTTKTEIQLKTFVEKLLEDIYVIASLKNVQLRTFFHWDGIINIDGIKFSLILRNLILNGIYYQRQEEANKFVELHIDREEEHVLITITDNGKGLPQDNFDTLFDMFQRNNKYKTGTGLGLFIVSKAIEKLQGELSFNSEPNKGTTFDLKLPIH